MVHMKIISVRTLIVGILIGFGPLTGHAQAAVVTVPLDVFTPAQTNRNDISINVDFDGATRTINFPFMQTSTVQDPNANGLLAFTSNDSTDLLYFRGQFANGRPSNLERIRLVGFTLTGSQAGLNALNGNEILTFQDLSVTLPGDPPELTVQANNLQIGFNAIASTPLSEDFLAEYGDAFGKLAIQNSGSVTPNNDLRISSLRFELIAVPEPQTYALIAAALATLAVACRKYL